MRIQKLKISGTSGTNPASIEDAAYAHCARVASSHYENFPVASVLVPLRMHKHLFALYAFSRRADDIADEPWTSSQAARLDALDALERALTDDTVHSDDLMITAVRATLRDCGLPTTPLLRLLEAFRRDVNFVAPSTWDDVLTYCSFSANPVGELFLRLDHGPHPIADTTLSASDAICTALQITNFLQDLSIDLPRGRHYLPIPIDDVIARTRELYRQGRSVASAAKSLRVRLELRAIIAGGEAMLELCARRSSTDVRPALSARHIPLLAARFFRLA